MRILVPTRKFLNTFSANFALLGGTSLFSMQRYAYWSKKTNKTNYKSKNYRYLNRTVASTNKCKIIKRIWMQVPKTPTFPLATTMVAVWRGRRYVLCLMRSELSVIRLQPSGLWFSEYPWMHRKLDSVYCCSMDPILDEWLCLVRRHWASIPTC